ncbi:apolipoprotein N-acyltransferase [Helicobacter cappadocius]|uniref:Apolipoprotein N-acyltransferase n=1 Tax=Helicobacter cappadocius TaxID=3063998 RepID=A0AA90PSD2_9HELI|nr:MULTISPECIES: apolipoprotein N-acyltransferase [unclassified Helicobacter]MDO7252721.1 apolipoprotein N-acyltransferase [Helicobacter sp. faydin-H75]MDP2538589.1 apolipoprotein N-acyltransferase [Helicobacter sp. faydin-H76]
MRIFWALIFAAIFLLPVYVGGIFIYLGLEKTAVIFESFFGLLSIWIFLLVPRVLKFWFGFFVGLGLFYWTGLSFRFSPMEFLIPFVMIFVSIVYGVVFYFLLFYNSYFWRIFTLMIASYIHPFGFDWLVIESFFSYSIFAVDKWSFFGLILGVIALWNFRRYYKLISICFLLFALDWGHIREDGKWQDLNINTSEINKDKLNLKITTTDIPQSEKWEEKEMSYIVDNNFNLIYQAKQDHQNAVVLPETAFPFVLNRSFLIDNLKILGKDIVIIAGGLREDDNHRIYNSIYIFQNGNFSYIDKVVLAPFGEKIPLPEFLAKPLRKMFFGEEIGLSDAKKPGNIQIGKEVFRGAICYEGTSAIMYKDKPKYVIVISNNAWFVPSIEPILQRMLIKYYARLYKTVVIHSSNQSPSYVLSSSVFGDKNL